MNQNKLSFESENLVVDYISFNIQGLTDPKDIAKIAFYLSNLFGFNSQIKENYEDHFEDLISENRNRGKIAFIRFSSKFNPYWTGTIISFPGQNAAYLYSLIKREKIDWNLFGLKTIKLGRFDLHFLRKLKTTDETHLVKTFMKESYEYAKSKGRKVELEDNKIGHILRINDRKSSNYYRVYSKNTFLEFELEMKNDALKSIQSIFFSNSLIEFEEKITRNFYRRYKNSVVLHNDCTDWLLDKLRKLQKRQNVDNYLLTSYLSNIELRSFAEKERFFYFIQFLSFIQNYKRSKLKDREVYQIVFPVIDFLRFSGRDEKSHYQRTKILKIIQSFQTLDPILEKLSKDCFRSSVLFPTLQIEKKGKRKTWVVTLDIVETLYSYTYPFVFPASFRTYQNKYDLQVKIEILKSFASVEVEKRIYIRDIYGSKVLSNGEKTRIRKIFIELFNELKKNKYIQPTFKLISSSEKMKQTNQLTRLLLYQNKILLFQEDTNYQI